MEYRSATAGCTSQQPKQGAHGRRLPAQGRHASRGGRQRHGEHITAAATGTTGGKEVMPMEVTTAFGVGWSQLWCTAHGGGGGRRRQIGLKTIKRSNVTLN